ALREPTAPQIPAQALLPVQEEGTRPSRALPYELHVTTRVRPGPERPQVELTFGNTGTAGAVFHVYDRKHLDRAPRRFTVEPAKPLATKWEVADAAGDYDLWLIAPNGFHRHVTGRAAVHAVAPEVDVAYVG